MGDCECDRSDLILEVSDQTSQECCTVIDKTIAQARVARQGGVEPAVVSDQWDVVPSKDGWFSTLVS